jgi:hypothetical protein
MKVLLMICVLAMAWSCKKETRNEMKLDGEWKLQHIETYTYANNEEIDMTDTVIVGTMNLQRESGIYNNVTFTDWSPFPYDQLNWNTSARQMRVITFHTDGTPGAGLFNFTFNIEKQTLRKLVLVTYNEDDDLNLLSKTMYYFKK